MPDFKTLLVTTDFSDTSREAFPLAKSLAAKLGARILVAYVQEDLMPPFVGEYAQTSIQSIMQDQRKRAAEELTSFVKAHLGEEPAVECIVAEGIPHVEIVRLAEERKADMIVMATHGRGFIAHALFGSTTERVLRRAPCPVLTVRNPQAGG